MSQLFDPGPKRPRPKPRVLMHVVDASCDAPDETTDIVRMACRNCGSNDTRPVVRPNHKSEADHLRDRIETMHELFADIRKAVGGNSNASETKPYSYTLPWLPHSLMLRIDAAMNQEHRG